MVSRERTAPHPLNVVDVADALRKPYCSGEGRTRAAEEVSQTHRRTGRDAAPITGKTKKVGRQSRRIGQARGKKISVTPYATVSPIAAGIPRRRVKLPSPACVGDIARRAMIENIELILTHARCVSKPLACSSTMRPNTCRSSGQG